MAEPIRRIVIVGGGTAGWSSAVFLDAALNRVHPHTCHITLIESSDIGTIGVGEATVPTIKNFFKFCDIDERDLMVRCNASFKIAIRFLNWSGLGRDDVFWHPFGQLTSVAGVQLSHYWLAHHLAGDPTSFAYACSPAPAVCDAGKSPKLFSHAGYEGALEYAYHLDAGLLATYLKHLGKSRGVRHVVDNVTHVSLDDQGYIARLHSSRHGEIEGDLFVDCSGFRGFLINQTLGEPFISYADSLFCDSAIAIPVPTDDAQFGINPFTSATALSAGWVWHTPLFGRSGNGYVYSSAFITKDQAEQEFRAYLPPQAATIEARHIRMRVGRTRNPWTKNCVAIGLAGGFIEPLESTGIWFIELGLYNLLFNFPDRDFLPGLANKYNGIMQKYYEQIRDFIVLHYCTTHREDSPFWKTNKNHPAIPDSVQANLELWKAMMPNHEQLDELGFFKGMSYSSILSGMGHLPQRSLPILRHFRNGEADLALASIRQQAETYIRNFPGHYQYLLGARSGIDASV